MTACAFCGLDVYLPDLAEHPCCTSARRRGEASCYGCEFFKRRWERGETCPHVSGAVMRNGKPVVVRACCVYRPALRAVS